MGSLQSSLHYEDMGEKDEEVFNTRENNTQGADGSVQDDDCTCKKCAAMKAKEKLSSKGGEQ